MSGRFGATKRENAYLIIKALNKFYLEKEFLSTNVDHNVAILSQTVVNKLRNFVSNEAVLIDDNVPSWFNNKINIPIGVKSNILKLMKNKHNIQMMERLHFRQACLYHVIDDLIYQ